MVDLTCEMEESMVVSYRISGGGIAGRNGLSMNAAERGKNMRLGIAKDIDSGVTVLKDAEFESLCNITTVTDVSCVSFANDERYISLACKKKNIAALIVPYAQRENAELLASGKGVVLAENPKYVFHKLHNSLIEKGDAAYIGSSHQTRIGRNCSIHPTAVIAGQNVTIGDNVILQENVIIREGVEIGDNVKIMVGAIIGYDACLMGRDLDGNFMPLISAGRVKIGNYVQIGSYSAVSKGLFPYEVASIGDHSMVGFGVDLSHNDRIGSNVVVLDQSQVCGNVTVEDNAHLSPQVIISNRLTVEEKADVAIGSVVVTRVKKGSRVAGNYAIDNDKFLLWHRYKMRTK